MKSLLYVITKNASTKKQVEEINKIINDFKLQEILNVSKDINDEVESKLNICLDENGNIDLFIDDWLNDWDKYLHKMLQCFSLILDNGEIQFFLDYNNSPFDVISYGVQPNKIYQLRQEWIKEE